MKKILSIALAVALLVGLLVPAALAAVDAHWGAVSVEGAHGELIPERPITMFVDDEIILTLDPGAIPAGSQMRFRWGIGTAAGPTEVGPFAVSFRPWDAIEDEPVIADADLTVHDLLHRTFNDERMRLTGRAPGNVDIEVWCWRIFPDPPGTDLYEYVHIATISINVQPRPDDPGSGPPTQNNLCRTLYFLWNDLQTFYWYMLRPSITYAYYTAVNFITGFWRTIFGAIGSWFR